MHRFKGLFLILVLLIWPHGFLKSQETCAFQVEALVFASSGSQSIPGATVEFLNSETPPLVTDSRGYFSVDNLCEPNLLVRIRFVGYIPYQDTLQLSPGKNSFKIYLQSDIHELDEIMIEAERVEELSTVNLERLDRAALNRTTGNSLGQTLNEISGVTMLQSGPAIAKPVIHGLHSNRILILNNGIRQEGQQWGQEHAPEIDPFMADNLELVKGAAAVKYGSDAIGGVVLVNPSELPRKAGLGGKINAVGATNNGLYASSVLLEGGVASLKGFGWRIQGTFKRAGDANAPDYRLTNTGLKEQNFSLGLGYHKSDFGAELFFSSFDTEIGILRSAHIGNLTDLANAIGSDKPLFIEDFSYDINNPYQAVKHKLLKANIHKYFPNVGQLTVQYGLQFNGREEFDIRRAGRSDIPALSLNLTTQTLDIDLKTEGSSDWEWDTGITMMYQNNRNDPETGIRPLIPDFENIVAGVHLIGRYIQPNYELEFGGRYDYKHYLIKRFDRQNNLLKPEFNFSNFTGSAGALFRMDNNYELRLNLGTAWRAPHVNELFSEGLHHGAAAIEEGISDLQSEQAIKWMTSLEKATSTYSFSVSGYYNLINNYIFLRPEDVTLTIRGAFPVFRYRQTDARFMGVDADFVWRVTDQWSSKSTLSLIHAKDKDIDSPLINIPANEFASELTYKHDWANSNQFSFTLGGKWVDEQRNAPRIVTIEQLIAGNSDAFFLNDQSIFDFIAPPQSYLLFHSALSFKFPMASRHSLETSLTIDNLFNENYRDYLNRFRYYADDMGRNFSLRINYSF